MGYDDFVSQVAAQIGAATLHNASAEGWASFAWHQARTLAAFKWPEEAKKAAEEEAKKAEEAKEKAKEEAAKAREEAAAAKEKENPEASPPPSPEAHAASHGRRR